MGPTVISILCCGLIVLAMAENKDLKYSQLPQISLGLNVTYSTGEKGCPEEQAAEHAEGCAELSWDNDDFLTISFKNPFIIDKSFNPQPSEVVVFRCFSKTSTLNRAWRKPKDQISKDKQCKKIEKVQLIEAQRDYEYKYVIPSDAAEATYFIRLLVKCGDDYCADVNTQYSNDLYYGIKPMDSIPGGLIAGVVIAVIIAPTFLVLYFIYEFAILKK